MSREIGTEADTRHAGTSSATHSTWCVIGKTPAISAGLRAFALDGE